MALATPGIPSPVERRRVAALAITPERTVLRTYRDPARVQPSTLARITVAAQQLGVAPPVARAAEVSR